MNVLHLVWNLIRGGTEGQCARVAMELAGRGHRQSVLVFRREGYFVPMVEEVCGPVREIGISGMVQWQTVAAIRRLARRLKDEHVEVLHAWDADAAIFGQCAARLAGTPLITSRRDLGQIYPPHKRWLMRKADQRANLIVANAQAIVDEFVRQGTPAKKFRVIPNILDVTESDRLAQKPFSKTADLLPGDRVVMVARLDPEKDIPTFILAAEIMVRQHPDISFVIAGDGVERSKLEALALHHGLKNKLVFLGDITEVPALLRECRIGMLTPSRNEGLSNTILEYMAAGLPVVATDCGGNRELVWDGEGGMITPIGDAEKIAAAGLTLLRQPAHQKTMGCFNRERIEKEFQPTTIGDRFEELYHEVIRSAPV